MHFEDAAYLVVQMARAVAEPYKDCVHPSDKDAMAEREGAKAPQVLGQAPRQAIVRADDAVAGNRGDQREIDGPMGRGPLHPHGWGNVIIGRL